MKVPPTNHQRYLYITPHYLKVVCQQKVLVQEEVIFESLNYNNYTSKDIDMLITHQANLRITQYIQKKLNIDENNIFNNIMSYGNTTSASIPIALYEALEKNKIKRGDLV